MKKLFLLGAFILSIFAVKAGYSACCSQPCARPSCAQPCAQPCAPACDERVGECYCLYKKQEPYTYNTQRCVEEQVPYTRRCSRSVPKYYEVDRCQMVPQWYKETVCRNEIEYYDVQEYKTVTRTICEPQVGYTDKYYWKHECVPGGASPAPSYQSQPQGCSAPRCVRP